MSDMVILHYFAEGTPESEKALFKEEFGTMTRIGHHPNVVNTLGSCDHTGKILFGIVLNTSAPQSKKAV